jgi:formate hydrogenlyase subunit 3/multisubunit Na+/H+ antiporter MnhD subunit
MGGNLPVLVALFTLVGLAVQRTERRRRWLTALILLLPSAYLLVRWALYRGRVAEMLLSAGIALVLNGLFWLFIGRHHPPGSSDDIRVVGMEDE